MPFDKNDKPRDKQNEHLGIGNTRTYCLINENEIIPICKSFLKGNDADKSSKPLMSTSFDNVHVPCTPRLLDSNDKKKCIEEGCSETALCIEWTNKKEEQWYGCISCTINEFGPCFLLKDALRHNDALILQYVTTNLFDSVKKGKSPKDKPKWLQQVQEAKHIYMEHLKVEGMSLKERFRVGMKRRFDVYNDNLLEKDEKYIYHPIPTSEEELTALCKHVRSFRKSPIETFNQTLFLQSFCNKKDSWGDLKKYNNIEKYYVKGLQLWCLLLSTKEHELQPPKIINEKWFELKTKEKGSLGSFYKFDRSISPSNDFSTKNQSISIKMGDTYNFLIYTSGTKETFIIYHGCTVDDVAVDREGPITTGPGLGLKEDVTGLSLSCKERHVHTDGNFAMYEGIGRREECKEPIELSFLKSDKRQNEPYKYHGIGYTTTYCLIIENEIIPICKSFLKANDAKDSTNPLVGTSFEDWHDTSKVKDAHEEGSMLWRNVGEYFRINKEQGQNPPKPESLSNYKLVLHDGMIITPSPEISLRVDPLRKNVGIRLNKYLELDRDNNKTEFWWSVSDENEDYSTSKDERSFLKQITECFSQYPPSTKELWVPDIHVIGFARQGLALVIEREQLLFLSWEFFINVSVLFNFKTHSGKEVPGLELKLRLGCIGISHSACTLVTNQCDLRNLKPISSQVIDKIEIEENQVYNIRTLMPAVPELKLIYSCSPFSEKPTAFKCFCKQCSKRKKEMTRGASSNDFNNYALDFENYAQFSAHHRMGANVGSFVGGKEVTFVLQRLHFYLVSIHGQRQTTSNSESRYCNKTDGRLINDSFDKNKGVVNIAMSSALRWTVFHNPIDPNYLDPLIYHEGTIHQHLNKYFTYLGPIVVHRYMKSRFLRKSKLLFDFLEETKPKEPETKRKKKKRKKSTANEAKTKPNGEKPIDKKDNTKPNGEKPIDADSPFVEWSKQRISTFSTREAHVQSNYAMTRVQEHFEAVRDVFNPSMLQVYDGANDRFVLYQYFLLLCIGDFNYAEFEEVLSKGESQNSLIAISPDASVPKTVALPPVVRVPKGTKRPLREINLYCKRAKLFRYSIGEINL